MVHRSFRQIQKMSWNYDLEGDYKMGRPIAKTAFQSNRLVLSNDATIFEIINEQGRKITNCHHKDRKHYAKGMCNYCYHKYGRSNKASACLHTDKVVYAKGLCHLCYHYKFQKRAIANKKAQILDKPCIQSKTIVKDNREVVTFLLEPDSSSEEED